MLNYLTIGIILGLSAGLAPGPLLTLVFSETLQNGIKSGIKIAVAPLITDLPIVLLAVFVVGELSQFDFILGLISLMGGFMVLYLGYENIRVTGLKLEITELKSKSLLKGVIVNFLSPHPYLFWFSIGAPMTVKAAGISYMAAFSFIFGFYLLQIGSKLVIAILVAKTRFLLNKKIYIYIMRLLGTILCILAFYLFYHAFILMGFKI